MKSSYRSLLFTRIVQLASRSTYRRIYRVTRLCMPSCSAEVVNFVFPVKTYGHCGCVDNIVSRCCNSSQKNNRERKLNLCNMIVTHGPVPEFGYSLKTNKTFLVRIFCKKYGDLACSQSKGFSTRSMGFNKSPAYCATKHRCP